MMRVSRSFAVVVAMSALVVGLLIIFAVQLSGNQSKSLRDTKTGIQQRGELATALITSLFDSTTQQIPTYTTDYGGSTINVSKLTANPQTTVFAAVLDSSGATLAASPTFTDEARSIVLGSSAWTMVTSGRPYGLGDLAPFAPKGVIPFVVAFPTSTSTATNLTLRYLVSGVPPDQLSLFLNKELKTLPGVAGSENYLLDSKNVVLSTSGPGTVGQVASNRHIPSSAARANGTLHGYYYDQIPLAGSSWRLVQSAPAGRVFAATRGSRLLIPWFIVAAFGCVAAVAIYFGIRAAQAADRARVANDKLEGMNEALSEANDSLERRARELERSNEELDQFAFIASHDLQEPLRKVRTFTEQALVLDGAIMSEKARDYLERSNLAAERMQQLISDLLAFARVSTRGKPFEPVDLATVTRDVIDDLVPAIEAAGAQVTVGDLPTINADRTQMTQLMQNLVSNSLKFRREGVQPTVSITAETHGDTVDIVVADNGIGFEPQYSQRIFRVFERLHGRSAYEGTGIGLALCRKIVERHGGRIVALGTPGVGATFTATLPTKQNSEVIVIHRNEPFHESVVKAKEDANV